LFAQWKKASYTITYYGNGNTGGTLPSKTTHLFQTEIIIASAGNLVKTGYSDIEGYFGSKDTSCGWWSSTVWENNPSSYAWFRYLVNSYEGFGKDGCRNNTGNSIRLIRD
jgi:hypothetical protein